MESKPFHAGSLSSCTPRNVEHCGNVVIPPHLGPRYISTRHLDHCAAQAPDICRWGSCGREDRRVLSGCCQHHVLCAVPYRVPHAIITSLTTRRIASYRVTPRHLTSHDCHQRQAHRQDQSDHRGKPPPPSPPITSGHTARQGYYRPRSPLARSGGSGGSKPSQHKQPPSHHSSFLLPFDELR